MPAGGARALFTRDHGRRLFRRLPPTGGDGSRGRARRVMTLQGEVIESVDGLIAIESEWWTLWREAPAATPFQSPAWLIPWWQAFAPGELLTVALRARGRLVALAPLYLESGALGRRLLPLGIGISDYLDVLLAPGRDDVAAALIDCCCRLTARWEVLELGELSANAAALGVPCPAQCTEIADRQSACPTMLLGAGTDESGLPFEVPGKRRQSYRRRRRAAEAAGGLEILAPGPDAFLEALTQLHARRWQAKGEPGVLADPRVREFHRLALPRLLRAGLARCTVAR